MNDTGGSPAAASAGWKVLGITGLARSGKDEAAGVLHALYGFMRMSHADPLKDAAAAMLGLPRDRMDGGNRDDVLPDWGFSVRWFLQRLGTEAVRDGIAPDFWLRALRMRMQKAYERQGQVRFVVPDVRFEDEATHIREMGGRMLHVIRPGLKRMEHASELGIEVKPDDLVVVNNDTLTKYHGGVIAAMEGWL